MLHRVQLYEQEPQHARLACGNARHQCAVYTMDIEIKSNIDSGTFRPMQLAAAQAYNNSVEWHEEANVNVYSRRRQLAEEIMKVLGCSFDPNQVGMFLWGRIPDSYNDVEELTEKFARSTCVHYSGLYLRQQRQTLYPYFPLCQRRKAGRSTGKN